MCLLEMAIQPNYSTRITLRPRAQLISNCHTPPPYPRSPLPVPRSTFYVLRSAFVWVAERGEGADLGERAEPVGIRPALDDLPVRDTKGMNPGHGDPLAGRHAQEA